MKKLIIWILMIATACLLGFLISCSNPLTDIIMNDRALVYTIPTDPEPIGGSDEPLTMTLLAGRTIDVGMVSVWIEEDTLYVQFESTWLLTETHLDVVTDPVNFPQTKKGNPKPGHFSYKMTHDPGVTDYTYEILMSEFEEAEVLYFAAHAAVEERVDGKVINSESAWAEGYDFPGANWATYFTGEVQPPAPSYEDGSALIVITEYDLVSGHQIMVGLIVQGTDPTQMENIIATAGFDIVAGEGSGFIISWENTNIPDPPPYILTGGVTYELYIWFDMNGNWSYMPEPGIDIVAIQFPFIFVADGNMVFTFSSNDFDYAN